MKIVTTNLRFKLAIGRNTTTGVIHDLIGGRSLCGASRRNVLLRLAEAQEANESRFCEKCFCGKPDAFYEVEV